MVTSTTVEINAKPYQVIGNASKALVSSQTQPGAYHVVRHGACDCKGFSFRHYCNHLRAVNLASSPALVCEHCGHRSTPESPVITRWERPHSHGEAVRVTRCQNEAECWRRWDAAHGLVS